MLASLAVQNWQFTVGWHTATPSLVIFIPNDLCAASLFQSFIVFWKYWHPNLTHSHYCLSPALLPLWIFPKTVGKANITTRFDFSLSSFPSQISWKSLRNCTYSVFIVVYTFIVFYHYVKKKMKLDLSGRYTFLMNFLARCFDVLLHCVLQSLELCHVTNCLSEPYLSRYMWNFLMCVYVCVTFGRWGHSGRVSRLYLGWLCDLLWLWAWSLCWHDMFWSLLAVDSVVKKVAQYMADVLEDSRDKVQENLLANGGTILMTTQLF